LGKPVDRGFTPALLAIKMWNHAPVMWAAMQGFGIEKPKLTPQDASDLVAFFYSSRYFDQPVADHLELVRIHRYDPRHLRRHRVIKQSRVASHLHGNLVTSSAYSLQKERGSLGHVLITSSKCLA
jgi:hypothetical protein